VPRESSLIPNDESLYGHLQEIASSRDSGSFCRHKSMEADRALTRNGAVPTGLVDFFPPAPGTSVPGFHIPPLRGSIEVMLAPSSPWSLLPVWRVAQAPFRRNHHERGCPTLALSGGWPALRSHLRAAPHPRLPPFANWREATARPLCRRRHARSNAEPPAPPYGLAQSPCSCPTTRASG
jgi:hypothetical protein